MSSSASRPVDRTIVTSILHDAHQEAAVRGKGHAVRATPPGPKTTGSALESGLAAVHEPAKSFSRPTRPPTLADLATGAVASPFDLGADLQTFGDRSESPDTIARARANVLLKGGAELAAGAVLKAIGHYAGPLVGTAGRRMVGALKRTPVWGLVAKAESRETAGIGRTCYNRVMAEYSIQGVFDVKLTPVSAPDDAVGRMTLAKTFGGDLTATSVGEMLAIRSAVAGSAGYVAMERATGILMGRAGSFALQHSGTMDRGEPSLSVTVVPDSGTEALTGLAGSMTIDPRGGEHRYTFTFTLPD